MRVINKHIVHCSASDHMSHDNVDVIRKWHLERGFSDIGYHFIITKDGKVHQGRPINVMGAHARGANRGSIGTCLTGDKEFSDAQFRALAQLDAALRLVFGVNDTIGHYQVPRANKTCPNFDPKEKIEAYK